MKLIKKEGNKYKINFEKTVVAEESFERDFVVNKIQEIQSRIDLMTADKNKYEQILTLIDNDTNTGTK